MSDTNATSAAAIPYSRPSTPHNGPLQIGFCGLGSMGRLMARNLATCRRSDSPPMLVYNRSISKAHELATELSKKKIVVTVAQSLDQLAKDCDIIITSLANDEAAKTVYRQFAQALKGSNHTKSKIFVETSTIYPTVAGELLSLISGPRVHFITSPVFGAPPAADAAQLVIIMAGDLRCKKEVAHLLIPAIGRKVIDLGDDVEKAPMTKLIGNSLILGSMELIGESMTLAEKSGVGAKSVNELIKELIPSPPWLGYSDKMLNDKFDGTKGFTIDNGIKDASHIRALAAANNAAMPVIDVAHQHLLTARALHAAQGAEAKHEVLDWSALVAGSRLSAGLDGLDSSKKKD